MSTILVNNIKSYTGTTVTISGSNISVTGNTTLGDGAGIDKITINGDITASANISASGDITAKNLTAKNLTLSGDATIKGNLTFGDSTSDSVSFGAEISSSIIPDADDTYDLGSSAKQWKDLYLDGTANLDAVSASVGIHAPNAQILGIARIGIANIGFIQGVGGSPTSVKIGSASIDNISSSLIPDLDDTYDLGSSAKQWKDLHIDGTANIDTLSVPGISTLGIANVGFIQGVGGSPTSVKIGSASIDNVSSSLIPDLDDTYDLGSSAKQWKDLHIDGTAFIDNLNTGSIDVLVVNNDVSSSLIPDVDDAFDLGTSEKQWKDLYIDGTANIDTVGNGVSIPSISSSVDISGSITPRKSATGKSIHDLGSSAKQWRDLYINGAAYIDQLSGSGTAGDSAITASVNIVPGVDDTYDLGSPAKQWKDLYIDGTANIDSASIDTADINGGTIDGITSLTTTADITAASLTLNQNIQSAANTDKTSYSINGKRGEIRSQLQASVAADTGFTLELRNTSIAANSLVIASVIAPSANALSSGGIVSGSVICGNVIAANTASINFFNTGVTLLDNSKFTASFAVL